MLSPPRRAKHLILTRLLESQILPFGQNDPSPFFS